MKIPWSAGSKSLDIKVTNAANNIKSSLPGE
jgi:hypothetical protein